MTLYIDHVDEIDTAARQLLAEGRERSVWLFDGDMGAGKTTLIKALCRTLGVISTVQSPTFSIVNEYTTHEGHAVYHFDCYRLRNEAEALDIGIEEYIDSGNYLLYRVAGENHEPLAGNVLSGSYCRCG